MKNGKSKELIRIEALESDEKREDESDRISERPREEHAVISPDERQQQNQRNLEDQLPGHRDEKRDRRFYRLKLTDEGVALLAELEPGYLELVHGIMEVFTPEERTRLTEYMVRLQSSMEQWK